MERDELALQMAGEFRDDEAAILLGSIGGGAAVEAFSADRRRLKRALDEVLLSSRATDY